MKQSNRKDKGFTLIEILLVVGFIALASIGIYSIYTKVQATNDANVESRNLDTFRAGIKTLYATTSSYATITNTVVNAARITPDQMRTAPNSSDGVITNTFGGAVTILPVALGGGANNGFEITYPNVPGSVCSKLVGSGGGQFDRIVVGTTTVKAYGSNRLQEDAAAVACNAAPVNGITITFASI